MSGVLHLVSDAGGVGASIFISLLLRALIGLHGYSGQGKPPKYGDYEAQRHWMEITLNLPAKDWYRNTTDNVLDHWGLDYPPLSGYQSWVCGSLLQKFDRRAVELRSSWGFETTGTKVWMRMSVMAFDILVLFPAMYAAVLIFNNRSSQRPLAWLLAVALLQPAALLIDHGHFQYNNISLGLSAGAAAAIASGWHLTGSIFFCLALNHKHMTLYYAPAFFAHLLGCCLQKSGTASKVWAIARLAAVVLVTFAICWLPWLGSWTDVLQVLRRLTPIDRGLFEDYVANFWCVSHLVIKWERLFSQQALVKMAGLATFTACLPSMWQQLRSPSPRGLLYSMANTAAAFYIFSYQVHEKSVLLPLLPISLLADQEPLLAFWLPIVASCSMFPLLKKDGLSLAYAAVLLFWTCIQPSVSDLFKTAGKVFGSKDIVSGAGIVTVVFGIGLHAVDSLTDPPKRLPYLYDALFVSVAFVHMLLPAVYLNFRQWGYRPEISRRQKKQV